jgi:hypothetical protein
MTNIELCKSVLRPVVGNILETMGNIYDLSDDQLDALEAEILMKAYDRLFDLAFYEVKKLQINITEEEE